jgi:hypothetical protein
MRKYEVAYLTETGLVEDFSRLAPAIPLIEDCFAAIGRGAIVQTAAGPVAVEDLIPGDQIRTRSGKFETLKWRGAIDILPDDQNARPDRATLVRITADALGFGRPGPDVVLGPAARLLHRAPGVRTLTGDEAAFVPARDFCEGSSVIEIRPLTGVTVYQLGFDRHEAICVNGIEIETLHPGAPHTLGLRHDMHGLFMSLFPHKADLSGFGRLLHPRIRLRDLDLFDVA